MELATNIQKQLIYRVLEWLVGLSCIKVKSVSMSEVLYTFQSKQNATIKNISLILLNVNALKLQPSVVILKRQKLINKKEVNPINSHPSKIEKKLLLNTKNIIENSNQFIRSTNSSPLSSNLK
ncbi:MAG: hypothetical protein KA275_06435 [Chitinophagaceae bacterium]|jgi:Fe2+ or Zn2+ uptake regulation protein|nr:hypothetical protein [Chitinophagaceae bacterium]